MKIPQQYYPSHGNLIGVMKVYKIYEKSKVGVDLYKKSKGWIRVSGFFGLLFFSDSSKIFEEDTIIFQEESRPLFLKYIGKRNPGIYKSDLNFPTSNRITFIFPSLCINSSLFSSLDRRLLYIAKEIRDEISVCV